MNMKRIIYSALAVVIVAAACSKVPDTTTDQSRPQDPQSVEPGEQPQADELVTYTFTAVAGDEAAVRSTLTDGGVFSWAEGDEIAIYNDNISGYVNFRVTAVDAGTGVATIKAEASPGAVWTNAIYPAARAAGSGSTIDYTVSTVSGPVLVSKVSGQELSFKYLGAVVNVKVSGFPASAAPASLTFTANTGVFGSLNFSWNGDTPGLSGFGSGESITVPYTSGIASIPVPQTVYAGFTITVDNAEGRHLYVKSTSNNFDLTGKKLLVMPELTYARPKFYYVRTRTTGTTVYDGDQIMFPTGDGTYELWENCDANTTAYVYDEYNIGNDVTGKGCLAMTAEVNDGRKYKISYNPSTNEASMEYISDQYPNPYNWAGFYSNVLYLHGSFDGSTWTDESNPPHYFSGSNHVLTTTVTTTSSSGQVGLKASGDWWSANTGDGNYKTITSIGNGVYAAVFVKGSTSNQALTDLPAGSYTVYANILQDDYDDRPIRLMFVETVPGVTGSAQVEDAHSTSGTW